MPPIDYIIDQWCMSMHIHIFLFKPAFQPLNIQIIPPIDYIIDRWCTPMHIHMFFILHCPTLLKLSPLYPGKSSKTCIIKKLQSPHAFPACPIPIPECPGHVACPQSVRYGYSDLQECWCWKGCHMHTLVQRDEKKDKTKENSNYHKAKGDIALFIHQHAKECGTCIRTH